MPTCLPPPFSALLPAQFSSVGCTGGTPVPPAAEEEASGSSGGQSGPASGGASSNMQLSCGTCVRSTPKCSGGSNARSTGAVSADGVPHQQRPRGPLQRAPVSVYQELGGQGAAGGRVGVGTVCSSGRWTALCAAEGGGGGR